MKTDNTPETQTSGTVPPLSASHCSAPPSSFWKHIEDHAAEPPDDAHVLFRTPAADGSRDDVWMGWVCRNNSSDPLDWEWNCVQSDGGIERIKAGDAMPTHWAPLPKQAWDEIYADQAAKEAEWERQADEDYNNVRLVRSMAHDLAVALEQARAHGFKGGERELAAWSFFAPQSDMPNAKGDS